MGKKEEIQNHWGQTNGNQARSIFLATHVETCPLQSKYDEQQYIEINNSK